MIGIGTGALGFAIIFPLRYRRRQRSYNEPKKFAPRSSIPAENANHLTLPWSLELPPMSLPLNQKVVFQSLVLIILAAALVIALWPTFQAPGQPEDEGRRLGFSEREGANQQQQVHGRVDEGRHLQPDERDQALERTQS